MILVRDEEKFIMEVLNRDELTFIFFYTPMCGTCHLAKRFLKIVEKMDGIPSIYEVDANYFRRLTNEWEITSVPSFVVTKGDKQIETLYAFESVTKVYEYIRSHSEEK